MNVFLQNEKKKGTNDKRPCVDQVIVPSSSLCCILSYTLSVTGLHVIYFALYLADPPSKTGGVISWLYWYKEGHLDLPPDLLWPIVGWQT